MRTEFLPQSSEHPFVAAKVVEAKLGSQFRRAEYVGGKLKLAKNGLEPFVSCLRRLGRMPEQFEPFARSGVLQEP